MTAAIERDFKVTDKRAEAETIKRSSSSHGVTSPVHSSALGPDNSYDLGGLARGIYNSYQPLAYHLPWEVLEYVELLSTYNSDYSQAVDNIRTLANSGHEVHVDAGAVRATNNLRSYLNDLARSVQPSSGGVDGVIDKLLDQAAVYGAMAGEWLLDGETGEVVDFADINPKAVRFFWNKDTDRFEPWQKVSAAQAQAAQDQGREVVGGCVKLNETTFHYYSFDAAPNSPYGTPPFIAALEPIGIQREMVANMSQIVKKIGLLGIIDLSVEQLPPKPGETDEAFAARAANFLDQYVDAAEDMVRDGGMVHFDDVTVKTESIAGNAAGATNIFKQNEELVFSGLKSMPSVQGRSYSTTETYAGVAYDIIIRNTQRYQRACKRMIEAGYWLAAQAAGFNPETIALDFNPNKTLQRLQNAQAEQLEIKNAAWKWGLGLINQDGVGQELGYPNVDHKVDEPPDWITGATPEASGSDALDSTGGGKPNNQNNRSDEESD